MSHWKLISRFSKKSIFSHMQFSVFCLVTSNRNWGNSMKLQEGKFRLEKVYHRGWSSTETNSPEQWSCHQTCWRSRRIWTMLSNIWFDFWMSMCADKSWTPWSFVGSFYIFPWKSFLNNFTTFLWEKYGIEKCIPYVSHFFSSLVHI